MSVAVVTGAGSGLGLLIGRALSTRRPEALVGGGLTACRRRDGHGEAADVVAHDLALAGMQAGPQAEAQSGRPSHDLTRAARRASGVHVPRSQHRVGAQTRRSPNRQSVQSI